MHRIQAIPRRNNHVNRRRKYASHADAGRCLELQDWETFEKRHAAHVDVFWPGQALPTHSRPSHKEEAIAFFKIFPDNKVGNRPYKIFFGQGDYTCSVAEFTGTFKGPMNTPDGKVIPAQR